MHAAMHRGKVISNDHLADIAAIHAEELIVVVCRGCVRSRRAKVAGKGAVDSNGCNRVGVRDWEVGDDARVGNSHQVGYGDATQVPAEDIARVGGSGVEFGAGGQ